MKRPPVVPLEQHTFPGGFVVKIRSTKKIANAYGWYQRGTNGGTIVIDGTEPAWRRLKTFGHELAHAANDYAHWCDSMADKMKEEGEATLRALKEEEE